MGRLLQAIPVPRNESKYQKQLLAYTKSCIYRRDIGSNMWVRFKPSGISRRDHPLARKGVARERLCNHCPLLLCKAHPQ